jgi:putative acetyltransferase
MHIRRAKASEREILLEIWLRSVRATHHFVPAQEIDSMIPDVRSYLASEATQFWVATDERDAVMGFAGMAGSKMESLFLAPEFQRRGIGRQLVRYMQQQHGELRVDVNEQNSGAVDFYRSCGFVVDGRSPLDDQGRPYPLLHLRLPASATAQGR